MNSVRLLVWLLPRRLKSSWQLLAVSAFGILAAATVLSVGVVYSQALSEGGLRHTLASSVQWVLNAQVLAQDRPLAPGAYPKLRNTVESIANTRLGYLMEDTERFGNTPPRMPMLVGPQVREPEPEDPLARMFFLTGFEEHSRLVAGRWPQAEPVLHDKGLVMETVLGMNAAGGLALGVGSEVNLLPFYSTPSERITLHIVGIAEPINRRDEFWMGYTSYFEISGAEPIQVPFFVREQDFFGGLGQRYPTLIGNFGWYFYLDVASLTTADIDHTRDALHGLELDINRVYPSSIITSGLENRFREYERKLTLARVPLFLFISLVALVTLYFLAVATGFLSARRREEASLLRSRGASAVQIGGLLMAAEGVIALVAIAVGPFLALLVVRGILARTINPLQIGQDPLVIGLSAEAFILSAVGGVLSLLVLVLSEVRLMRLGVVDYLRERARPPSVPFLQRYYIDFLAVGALGLLWWQIQGRGGFLDRDLLGRALEVDPTLLFGPALVVLTAALLMLRVMPLTVRFLAWAADRAGPAWLGFSLSRVARDPLPYGSLVIILMMSSALGVFGAVFQSSLSQSQREQQQYAIGGDVVVHATPLNPGAARALSVSEVPRIVSPVIREPLLLYDGFAISPALALMVEPSTLVETAWFRKSFAGKELDELLAPLHPPDFRFLGAEEDPRQGIPIPLEARRLGVWARGENLGIDPTGRDVRVWARLVDSSGFRRDVRWGNVRRAEEMEEGEGSDGWTYLETALPPQSRSSHPPYRITAIFMSRTAFTQTPPGSLSLDEITIKGPGLPPSGMVIEDFDEPGLWGAMNQGGPEGDTVQLVLPEEEGERSMLTLSWQEPLTTAVRGVVIPPGPWPIPAIGGPSLEPGTETVMEIDERRIPIAVQGTTDFFPTLTPGVRPFVIIPLDAYVSYLDRIPGGNPKRPNQFWLALHEDQDRAAGISTLRQELPRSALIRDRQASVDRAQRDPLAGGGWAGLTILSVSALAVAAILVLGAHAAISVYRGRVDLAVVGALGLSTRQMMMGLVLERVVVAVLGIGAGVILGLGLGPWVLSYLDITPTGRDLLPPMEVTAHAWLIGLTFAELAFALALAVVIAVISASRLKAADVLRAS